jgi:phenylacetate-coenzyme A ligase PaaK-like adenylate-forming protein
MSWASEIYIILFAENMIDANAIFNLNSDEAFDALAVEVFKFQFENNAVYRSFCDLLYKHPSDVKTIEEIPFLPIQFFKSHRVLSSKDKVSLIFSSSGTTGAQASKHYITDLSYYKESFLKGFEHFYGAVSDYAVLALLPSYLERKGSSLIYMANDFIMRSGCPESGFYLDDLDGLAKTLLHLESKEQKTLLIGVSFALLDLIEKHQFKLKHTIVMETGGMKGRRKELIRKDLHEQLKNGFGLSQIHSEYGMTELLSQAYSMDNIGFQTPPWMKILIRDTEDALSILNRNRTGGINVIDLANVNSCSFIATQDLGKLNEFEGFEVLGRFDNSEVRGCNLMVV